MAQRKMNLVINGVERMLICDPDNDKLSDVIRRIGLTGTKIGCGTGQCGACNVILNGKLVRSCVRKMKQIPDHSEIITVEGIGQPGNLHPVQQALMYCGAIQCGFCMPGFVVSSYALLQQNQNPTRAEVREWFTKNRNACRCTGYKQIVDAVMLAAEVMRGEKTMDDITYHPVPGESTYGKEHVQRPAALAKVTGLCDYGDDIGMKMSDDTLHLAVVFSGVSHGNIKNIDYSEAEKMPGVVKVITAKDVQGTNILPMPTFLPRSKSAGNDQEVLVTKKVCRYGDVVALVAADTKEHARAAAAAVVVDVEELPAYYTIVDAVAPGAMEIHEGVPNDWARFPLTKGEDTKEILENSEYVVEGSFHSGSQCHLVIEPDCGQAYFDEDGNLTLQGKWLNLYFTKALIAPPVGIDPDKLRLIENPTGASFGYSLNSLFGTYLAIAAMDLKRPVTMTLSYKEHNVITGKRLEGYSNGRMGCDKDGKITGFEFDFSMNSGGYTAFGEGYYPAPLLFCGFGYNIPNVRAVARCAMSNQSMPAPYRGSRSTQSYTMSEQIIDMLAREAGIDPLEFRYINASVPGDKHNADYEYRDHPFQALLDTIRPYYKEAKERQETLSTDTKKRGVGITMNAFNIGDPNDYAEVALGLNEDGSITVYNTWEDQGQGGDIGTVAVTTEALKELHIGYDDVKFEMNDTLLAPPTGGSGSNRQHYMAGNATKDAADQLLAAMRKEDGTYRTYAEMVEEGIPTKYTGSFSTAPWTIPQDPDTGHGDWVTEYNYVAVMTEVEVDVETGVTTPLKFVMAFDIGTIGSPDAVRGQAYSALMHGLGFALREKYIDDGNYDSLTKCGFTFCNDMPDDITLISVPVSDRKTPAFGGVGCCEGFQSSVHSSVCNAIFDASGVRIYEIPATPDKVKAGIEAQKEGKEIKPHWFLGSDFRETLEDMLANPVMPQE